jgi:hypothetical protein
LNNPGQHFYLFHSETAARSAGTNAGGVIARPPAGPQHGKSYMPAMISRIVAAKFSF